MLTICTSNMQSAFSYYTSQAEKMNEIIQVTKNGKPRAVVIPWEMFEKIVTQQEGRENEESYPDW